MCIVLLIVCLIHRALLQLSALCLHTYNTSDLLPCLLNFLLQLLAPYQSDSAPPPPLSSSDSRVLQWVVLLMTHFLSAVILPSSQNGLYIPLTVPMVSDSNSGFPPMPSKVESGSDVKREQEVRKDEIG